jgi:hypothetical protein
MQDSLRTTYKTTDNMARKLRGLIFSLRLHRRRKAQKGRAPNLEAQYLILHDPLPIAQRKPLRISIGVIQDSTIAAHLSVFE